MADGLSFERKVPGGIRQTNARSFYSLGNEAERSRTDSLIYVYIVIACKNNAWKAWERNPRVLPTLPKFEDWQAANFHFDSGVPLMQPPCWRVFSARSYDVIAILTSTVNIIDFLAQHPSSIVMEEPSVQAAQNALNWVLLRHILPFSPYLVHGLPCLQNLPLDTIIPVDFAEKFKECLSSVPTELPYAHPQWQLTAPEGGNDHDK